MADNDTPEENATEGTTTNGAAAKGVPPGLKTLAQYVKDFSFENPNAPASFQPQQGQPEIDISVNVNANPLNETDYEVTLKVDAVAKTTDKALFNAELVYAGIFRITGLSQEQLHPVVFIECPRLLFPFARQVIAESTRSGGFPPLIIDPVDFASLYRQRVQQAQADNGDNQESN